ncbi:MAG TPA: DUF979 domain-containing protein [Gemmatimonadaceae bacterium]|jgi:uncharacterized membrane protein
MITLEFVDILMGLMFGGIAVVSLRDKRFGNALFWALWSETFLFGTKQPPFVSGLAVIAMVVVMMTIKLRGAPPELTTRAEQRASAERRRNWLFLPALAIPALTLAGTFGFKYLKIGSRPVVDPKQITLISLGGAILVALLMAVVMLRPKASVPMTEARRLMDAVSWAAVLPQALAALGAMFALAGVGPIVASLVQRWVPLDTVFSAVAAYAIGMALFTAIMGNAFAAFPVMTAGIGLPLLAQHFGGNVVVICAIGMLSGYSGTLITPMAANFNIVPVALLELPDQNAVIKVQIPTAILLLATNIVFMYLFAFHR